MRVDGCVVSRNIKYCFIVCLAYNKILVLLFHFEENTRLRIGYTRGSAPALTISWDRAY